ncbi:kelch repeat-containing protein [Rheinheimera sp. F8]|uniref:Kelch repeat-containing protein n=1 Tax=Rheinheimera sp. F8 TaxID=1763998 RepID=UPI000744A632|nr:kelch repeat-containing protein [Rheinheimera sp. F8]ALZ77141.1 hypothetical protein ATY27_16195 [Rheinheimera sp. F8]
MLDTPEDNAVLFTPDKPLTYLTAAATCPTEPVIATPRRQQVSVLSDGRILLSGGVCPKTAQQHQGYPALWLYDTNAADGQQWQPVGQLHQPRLLHTSTTLPDDSVLLIGGVDPAIRQPAHRELPQLRMLASVELWQDQRVTLLPPLPVARALHSTTRLPDGQILVAGGLGADLQPLRDTWLYRSGEPKWRQGPDLPQAVFDHTALQTRFGLLIAGGRNAQQQPLLQTLLLREIKDGFAELPPLMLPIAAGHLTQNLHGELLLSGGYTADDQPNPLLLRWDGEHWQQVFSQPVPNQRSNWSVQAQPDGHWLLASNDALYQLALQDKPSDRPATAIQSYSHYPRGDRSVSPNGSTVAQLPDGRLLVAGGGLTGTSVATTFSEVVDPRTGRWQKTAPTLSAHFNSEAVVLPDGRVLLYGGISDSNGSARQSARHHVELFDPEHLTWQQLPNLEFAADERVQARLQPDGSVLFVAANEYNITEYTRFRAVRFEPATGQIQSYQAPASSYSADPLQPPAQPLPAGAFWQLREDGSVALLAGHWATYIAEPDCAGQMRQANAAQPGQEKQATTLCPAFDEDINYGWQGAGTANDQIWLWRISAQTIAAVPGILAQDGSRFQFSDWRTTPITSSNGDLLFKQRGPNGQTLLRWRQQDLAFEWLPPHPQDIWQDERLFGAISWFALGNGGLIVADYYLAPGSQSWQALPSPEVEADWLGGLDEVYAVSFTAPYSAKLTDFNLDGTQSTGDTAATTMPPPPLRQKAHWQFVTDFQLPASAQTASGLLALANGDVLQALQQTSNQLRLQIWRSDTQHWQVLPAPAARLASPAQLLQLPDQQIMLLLQAYLPASNQTELRCYLSSDNSQTLWQACGTFAVTDSSEFALAALDDGSPALMINPQQAQLFDLQTRRWSPQVPYQRHGELINGVAVRLAAPVLSLGDKSTGASRAADALGAKFLERNPSGNIPKWQWSASRQQWAYIFMDSPMGRDAVELSGGCWLSFAQQQFVLFNPGTGKVQRLPERYAVDHAVLAKRVDDSLLLVGYDGWRRTDVSRWFQASCAAVTPLAAPAATVPVRQAQQVAAKAHGSANTGPATHWVWPRWQQLALALAPLFYPGLGLLLLLGLYYRMLSRRHEPAPVLQWAIRITVLVVFGAGVGQKVQHTTFSGEVSPLSESCISKLQQRLSTQTDASDWPTQLGQCIPMADLPELDCRFIGTWSQHNELMSQTSYISRLDANGRYTVTDASGGTTRDYRGYWGLWQDKLVWFTEGSVDPFADANPIVSVSVDTIVIRESNGSKTTLRRQDQYSASACTTTH